jgi:hypothetical protein
MSKKIDTLTIPCFSSGITLPTACHDPPFFLGLCAGSPRHPPPKKHVERV